MPIFDVFYFKIRIKLSFAIFVCLYKKYLPTIDAKKEKVVQNRTTFRYFNYENIIFSEVIRVV